MIFTGDNAQMVCDGLKTQTRRLKKEGDSVVCNKGEIVAVYRSGRLLWRRGRTYAIQDGRGKPQIGRFTLLRIREEDLQGISSDDACAEIGRSSRSFCWYGEQKGPHALFSELWDSIHRNGFLVKDNPTVFVLDMMVQRGAHESNVSVEEG